MLLNNYGRSYRTLFVELAVNIMHSMQCMLYSDTGYNVPYCVMNINGISTIEIFEEEKQNIDATNCIYNDT